VWFANGELQQSYSKQSCRVFYAAKFYSASSAKCSRLLSSIMASEKDGATTVTNWGFAKTNTGIAADKAFTAADLRADPLDLP
jgi:hypothetical protein